MVTVLGNLTVDGVVGSYRDFEVTRLIVMGDLTVAGLECDEDIFVDGTVSADIIWLEGNEEIMQANAIEARVLYSGNPLAATMLRATLSLTKMPVFNNHDTVTDGPTATASAAADRYSV